MNIINEIQITNYKGLENIDLPCGSINIIVGPNNTGKSSLLESIWLGISSLNNFRDSLNTEISDVIRDKSNFKHLVNINKSKSNILLKLQDNNEISLDLDYVKKGYPKEIETYFSDFLFSVDDLDMFQSPMGREYYLYRKLINSFEQKFSNISEEEQNRFLSEFTDRLEHQRENTRKKIIQSNKTFITSKLNGNIISIYSMMNQYDGEIATEDGHDMNIPLIVSSSNIKKDLHQLYGKLVDTKKVASAMEAMKKRVTYFDDIRERDDELLVLLDNVDEALPLSFMGDGFKALLKLSFMAPIVKKGIVLFEEPEISMHPGYLEVLAEEIISNSENSQFFITTHSLELLEYLLSKAEKLNKSNSINVIKLSRLIDGNIVREIIMGDEAKDEMEMIKTDLRGC